MRKNRRRRFRVWTLEAPRRSPRVECRGIAWTKRTRLPTYRRAIAGETVGWLRKPTVASERCPARDEEGRDLLITLLAMLKNSWC